VQGRPIKDIGAHCTGHNAHSIGICYIGGRTADMKANKDTRTPAQKKALVELITALRRQFPNAKVFGHRDLANRLCPCFDAKEEYKHL
jgi:N-acetylmuramoyl-L-alanine amidase